jgi:2-dehydro-3-deoxyphosphooctonate aldolase (KDO 8-P synthase)
LILPVYKIGLDKPAGNVVVSLSLMPKGSRSALVSEANAKAAETAAKLPANQGAVRASEPIQADTRITTPAGVKPFESTDAEIKKNFDCPILTDIHNEEQCNLLANCDEVDILQIPAFLCRQTDLLACAAKTNKIINVKKGQFLAPWDAQNIVQKIDHNGNNKTMLTERGVSFGYNTLISDMRSLPIMAKTGCPVIFDATHSVQQPGGLGGASGGQREFVETLACAATAVGVAGLFIETHQDPDNAPSDGPCMLRLDSLESLLTKLKKFDEIAKNLK